MTRVSSNWTGYGNLYLTAGSPLSSDTPESTRKEKHMDSKIASQIASESSDVRVCMFLCWEWV